jgi:hypothetical protein
MLKKFRNSSIPETIFYDVWFGPNVVKKLDHPSGTQGFKMARCKSTIPSLWWLFRSSRKVLANITHFGTNNVLRIDPTDFRTQL